MLILIYNDTLLYIIDSASSIQFQPKPKKDVLEKEIRSEYNVTCSADKDGEPAATLYWKKNGIRLSGFEQAGNQIVLVFPSVNGTDYGNYSCNASNSAGWFSSSFTFIPLCKYFVKPSLKGNNQTHFTTINDK